MKRWIIYVLGGVLIVAVIAGLLLSRTRAAAQQGTWQTVAAATGPLTSTIGATGTVRANQYDDLGFNTTGTVAKVYVQVGDSVKAGTVLADLQDSSLPAQVLMAESDLVTAQRNLDTLRQSGLASANAELALAKARDAYDKAQRKNRTQQGGNRATAETIKATEADLNYAEVQVKQAENNAKKYSNKSADDPLRAAAEKALYDARHNRDVIQAELNWYTGQPTSIDQAILDGELAQAKATLDDAQREYDRLKNGPDPNDIAAAEAQVAAAKATLELKHITAPFDGIITSVDVKPGDQVAPGTPAFGLANLTRKFVDVEVSEVDINSVQVGQDASLSFDAILNKTYQGKVTEVGIVGQSVQGVINFTVTVELQDADAQVKPGLTAAVNIVVEQLENVLTVPNAAVRVLNNNRVVYVLRNGKPTPVTIVLGASSDTASQVVSGDLKDGDLIVLNPPLVFSQNGPPGFVRQGQ
jgi:HlyD family secretion protein